LVVSTDMNTVVAENKKIKSDLNTEDLKAIAMG
jgi:hypothetical protein